MRALVLVLFCLGLIQALSACGAECGDGTVEKDGDCVASDSMTDEEVSDRCADVCSGAEWACQDFCFARAAGVTPRVCQNCLVVASAHSAYDTRTAALEACLPLCAD
jgi:hypothetical protein